MNVAVPNLPVNDLRIARAFHVDKLGFAVLFEATEDQISGLIGLERQGMRINLDSPMAGHGRQACVSLEVEDIDALHAEWHAVLRDLEPIQCQPWGARTFGLQDPDDNTIFVLGK